MTAHSDALTRLAGYYAAVSDKLNDDAVCMPPSDLTVEHLTVGDLGHAVAAMTFVRQVAREGFGAWRLSDEWLAEAKRLTDDYAEMKRSAATRSHASARPTQRGRRR